MAEYIERESLRKILDQWRVAHADVDDVDGFDLLEDVIREVDAQTAANVAPVVHGRWVFGGDGCVICSKCNEEESNDNHRNFCPNCGAKMDGGADHEAS